MTIHTVGNHVWSATGDGNTPVDLLVKPDIVERLESALSPLGTFSGKDGTAAEVIMQEAAEEIKRLRDDREWQIKQNVKMFEALEEISKADGTPENPKHVFRSALIQVAKNGMVEAV